MDFSFSNPGTGLFEDFFFGDIDSIYYLGRESPNNQLL